MEIGATTLAAREQFFGRSAAGQDIVQKSFEKAEAIKQVQEQDKPQEVRQPEADKQGRIDLYA